MSHLKIPQFWHGEDKKKTSPLLSMALLPFSWIYRILVHVDRAVTITETPNLPVICVGNVTMGGGGKTPTARVILNIAREHGKFKTPCFLMRGYGGNFSGAVDVDPTMHTQWDVGDEALMQAQYAPTIVARNRKKGAELALQRGYDLIIMDDGFQNFSLKKHLSLLVIDGGFGFGNGKCFPAGPLRETIDDAVKRANAALIINKTDAIDTKKLKDTRQFEATLKVSEHANGDTDNKKVIAFAGIARPQKFFKTLEDEGYDIHSEFGFSDHHIYTHTQLQHMYQRAQKSGSRLITTEKDWVRLSASWKKKIDYVKIEVMPEASFTNYITRFLDHIAS